MLHIKNISKKYTTGELSQTALKDVSLTFRDNEFVAVLGPSGSGKTTLLNIVGGLDRYDSGDLIINEISTKQYKDLDWDSYRNHTIGFVFQSYNLIPHQSVLSNVELALTISGISREERKKRALNALEGVGLLEHAHKKPNQLSGGQMQRVAIARALVNNPSILLADEPTGALDSETGVQVMELLKEVAKDRLVIMVTHNGELAKAYANRIVKLKDGEIIEDTNPVSKVEEESEARHESFGKSSMSFLTALSLSLNNLKTKKARTLLTAFAGSIGIIGIALILALSGGVNKYIDQVQKDTLSTYPLSIEKESVDLNSMMEDLMQQNTKEELEHDLDKIYSNNIATKMLSTVSTVTKANDLAAFKTYMENEVESLDEYISAIEYGYNIDLQIYSTDTEDGVLRLNPSDILENRRGPMGNFGPQPPGMEVFTQLLGNQTLIESQYDVLAGRMPESTAFDEVVVVVDKNNEISDMTLYSIGIMDQKEYKDIKKALDDGEEVAEVEQQSFSYDDILNTEFALVTNSDYYTYDDETELWVDRTDDEEYMKTLVDEAPRIKIVGILRPNPEASATSIPGTVAYTKAMKDYIIEINNKSEVAKAQEADSENDIFTGLPFDVEEFKEELTREDVDKYVASLPIEEQQQIIPMIANMSEEDILKVFGARMLANAKENASLDGNLAKLGVVDVEKPSVINIYPVDFKAKDKIKEIIEDYNEIQISNGKDDMTISYTDYVGLIMSSVTTIINMISYVLIGFVTISLVVSSIMIGIITYISVLERIKEIGVLRSLGASKKNISNIFNAETLIIGFVAGFMGIAISLLLLIPVNAIIENLSGVKGIAVLDMRYAALLVIISMILTLISGLIPAKKAAKMDPVTALRTD